MSEFKRDLTVHLGVFVFGAVILGAAVVWTGIDIDRRSGEVAEIRKEIQARLGAVAALSVLKSQKEEAEKLSGVLEKTVPSRDRLLNFSDEIGKTAEKNGVELRFSFGAETKAAGSALGSVDFTMSAKSSLANLLKFVEEVEKSFFSLRFSSFDVAAKDGVFTAVFNGAVLYR